MKDQTDIVKEWLNESASFLKADSQKLQDFLRTTRNNEALFCGLFDALSEDSDSTKCFAERLADFYRLNDSEARLFVLEFLPAVILAYLNSVYLEPVACHSAISACILSLYNATVAQSNAEGDFRATNLSRPSIYHDPETSVMVQQSGTLPRATSSTSPIAALAAGLLTTVAAGPVGIETAQNASSLALQNSMVTMFGAASNSALRITAELRYPMLTRLLVAYNRHVTLFSVTSLAAACWLCESICALDCTKLSAEQTTEIETSSPAGSSLIVAPHRVPVDHFFVTQLALTVCHALWNGLYREADRALAVAERRASHELFCDVLLLINAVRNSEKSAFQSKSSQLQVPSAYHRKVVVLSRPHIPVSGRQPAPVSGDDDDDDFSYPQHLDKPLNARSADNAHINMPGLSPARDGTIATVTVTLSSTCMPRSNEREPRWRAERETEENQRTRKLRDDGI